MSQEHLTFAGTISFDGGEPVYRHLSLTFAGDTAQLMSTTRHPEVQPLVFHLGPEDAPLLASLVQALRQQERDVPRLLTLGAEERAALPPHSDPQAASLAG